MVKPSKRSWNFLRFVDCDLIGDGISLDDTDSILQEFVAVLDGHIFYKGCVWFQSSCAPVGAQASKLGAKFQSSKSWMVIPIVGLIDVDAVILDVG